MVFWYSAILLLVMLFNSIFGILQEFPLQITYLTFVIVMGSKDWLTQVIVCFYQNEYS